jgi:phospholipid/cholesterol/gamma-HCH transport system substrate-binding protein
MKKDGKPSEIWTGVFVSAALLILLGGTLWIAGARPLGGHRNDSRVAMKSAGGVRSGDPVRVAGVEVGRVEGVRLDPGGEWPVTFRVELDAGVPVSKEATARLATDGLLGAPYLEIDPGPASAPPLPEGQAIEGAGPQGLDAALERVDDLAARATELVAETTTLVRDLQRQIRPVTERLADLLSEENVAEVEAAVAALRRTLEETGPRLPPLLDRLNAVAAELEEGVAEVPELSAEIGSLADDLQRALGPDGERLAGVLDAARETLDTADGALGVVGDNRAELEAAIRDLREATDNLRTFSQAVQEQPSRVLRRTRWPDRQPGDGPPGER